MWMVTGCAKEDVGSIKTTAVEVKGIQFEEWSRCIIGRL